MEDDASVIYGLEFQARALTAQTAETDAIRFLVGTQSLRFDNQVHFIDFDDDNNIINKIVFLHKEGEIWKISASPSDREIFATCYNKTTHDKSEMEAALWKIPLDFDTIMNDDSNNSIQPLELVCSVGGSEFGDVKCVIWHPGGNKSSLVSLAENNLLLWDLEMSGRRTKLVNSTTLEDKGQPKFTSGKWNPHHNCNMIATGNDTFIRGWDLRTMKQVWSIDNAHGQCVRDFDFNPNKQYYLASCGDDCKIRFWDIRNPTETLEVISDHSHWVWSIRYNHFHDQLVLSSSSDSRVILSNLTSISSEPFGNLVEDEENSDEDAAPKERSKDGVIATYEEHEDSVYAAEWSSADPWSFASLSYDGRVVINRVPRAEKYKILL